METKKTMNEVKPMTGAELAQALSKAGTKREILILGFAEGVKAASTMIGKQGA